MTLKKEGGYKTQLTSAEVTEILHSFYFDRDRVGAPFCEVRNAAAYVLRLHECMQHAISIVSMAAATNEALAKVENASANLAHAAEMRRWESIFRATVNGLDEVGETKGGV